MLPLIIQIAIDCHIQYPFKIYNPSQPEPQRIISLLIYWN